MINSDLFEEVMRFARHKVAVDAGANDGEYTEQLVRNGFIVHAFEPVPDRFKNLKARHRGDPNVFAHNIGLGEKDSVLIGVTVLEADTIGRPGIGGLHVSPQFAGKPLFNMRVRTLDSVLNTYPHHRIGVMKLDVDGGEYRVLKGARNMIDRDRPPILCKLGCHMKKVGDTPEDFINYIFGMGYNVVSTDGRAAYTTWKSIKPEYQFRESFNMMLIPK